MRAHLIIPAIALGLAASSAIAGNVTTNNGQIAWQSTQCQVPATPPSLSTNPETRANDMNARVADYNNFVQAVRAYTDCVSNEAQHDANAMSQAIISSAQAAIDAQRQEVDRVGAPYRPKTASAQ